MTVVDTRPNTDLKARKALGRSHINADRLEEALQLYAQILRDYPDDVDSYLFLGDCYLADGDGETAHVLYTQARNLDSGNPEIQRRLRLAQSERGSTSSSSGKALSAEALPTDPQAIADLLQRLTGRTSPVTEAEIDKAAGLLEDIVNSQSPAQAVAERLDEIDALLPALLELNIRQARADGRPDLAGALQDLLENINLQLSAGLTEGRCLNESRTTTAGGRVDGVPDSMPDIRVLFVGPAGDSPVLRQILPTEALTGLGCETEVSTELPLGHLDQIDVVVARRPHTDSKLMESLAACAASKTPIILDLDADYEQMPVDHPEYETLGLSTPARAKAYASAQLLADVICVPTEALAATLRSAGYPVKVIPDGWTNSNALWGKPASPRHTVNLGWIGHPGQIEDVAQVRRVIVRVMREFPHVRLVISGDAQVYRLFDSLPESRRLFLPSVSFEDYPYLLGQIDILVVPLRNNAFNRSLSDRRLMEAGIRVIPWVASPLPAFTAWNTGGIIANSPDEWHTYLRQLVLEEDLRASLGQAGRKRTEKRDMRHLGKAWFEMIATCLQ